MNTTAKPTSLGTAAIWSLQLLGTVGLLLLGYWWLLWPDEHVWQVVGSLATAVVLTIVALWLECGTIRYFAEPERNLFAAFRRAFSRIPAFLVWILIFIAVLWGLQVLASAVPRLSVRLAQLLSVRPRSVTRTLSTILSIVQWVVVPAVLLPISAGIAERGFGGWIPGALVLALRRLKSGWYWIALAVALGIGAYLPWKLIGWVPAPSTLKHESWSLGLRFTAAYVLAISAWVGFCWILGRGANASPLSPAHAEPSPDGGLLQHS